ncbi:hypothetical protein NC652_006795 [Populus alba x Populus x berolinensis]|nr:hypothetical protein NC652_006795 [Populus alba x Populus x berolinensis]
MTLGINNKFSQREYQRASSTTTTPASYIRCTYTLTSLRHVSPDVGLALSLSLSLSLLPLSFISLLPVSCLKKIELSFPPLFRKREEKNAESLKLVLGSLVSVTSLLVRELKQFFHINS